MKIAAIGDPHGNLEKIRGISLGHVDLILVTGDLGQTDSLRRQALQFLKIVRPTAQEKKGHAEGFRRAFVQSYQTAIQIVRYLAGQSDVLIVRGNADLSAYDTRKFARTFDIELPLLYPGLRSIKGVHLIDNRLVVFRGLRIGGIKYFTDMSWAEEFELTAIDRIRKIAARDTQHVKERLESFERVDILLTHIPPYGVLDRVDSSTIPPSWIGRHAGSRTILEYIKQKKPEYVFCGHIHEGVGSAALGRTHVFNLGLGGCQIVEWPVG